MDVERKGKVLLHHNIDVVDIRGDAANRPPIIFAISQLLTSIALTDPYSQTLSLATPLAYSGQHLLSLSPHASLKC
jgi:hypothetical protein